MAAQAAPGAGAGSAAGAGAATAGARARAVRPLPCGALVDEGPGDASGPRPAVQGIHSVEWRPAPLKVSTGGFVMSAPVQDDRDKRAMYVPPWARDDMHDEETRRIHAEIVQAAERLKPAAPPRQSVPEVELAPRFDAEPQSQNPDDAMEEPEPYEARPRRSG